MSYFTGENQSNDQNQTPPQTPNDDERDWLAEVVEKEGEAFKDPQALAKSVIHAQQHIAELERVKAEMSEDINKQDYLKEVLAKLEEKQNSTPPVSGDSASSNNGDADPEGQNPTDAEKIKELVQQTLIEREKTNTRDQNIRETDRMLSEAFGTNANVQVENRRNQLGMSKEDLEAIAAKSPTAFLTLMGNPPTKETNRSPAGSLNTQSNSMNRGKKLDFAHYQQLRKSDPKRYYSGRVQKEMLQSRKDLGDAFYQ